METKIVGKAKGHVRKTLPERSFMEVIMEHLTERVDEISEEIGADGFWACRLCHPGCIGEATFPVSKVGPKMTFETQKVDTPELALANLLSMLLEFEVRSNEGGV